MAAFLSLLPLASTADELEKLVEYHGTTPQSDAIVYAWPSWHPSREEEFSFPIQSVETVAGRLHANGFENSAGTLWLNDKPLVTHLDTIELVQVFPEKKGKPAVVLADLYGFHDAQRFAEFVQYHIIDLAVTPPFISRNSLPLGAGFGPIESRNKEENKHRPHVTNIIIRKLSDGRYVFSGCSFIETDVKGEYTRLRHYLYDRSKGTVVKWQPTPDFDVGEEGKLCPPY